MRDAAAATRRPRAGRRDRIRHERTAARETGGRHAVAARSARPELL